MSNTIRADAGYDNSFRPCQPTDFRGRAGGCPATITIARRRLLLTPDGRQHAMTGAERIDHRLVADKTPLYQHKKMTYPYSMNTPRTGRMGWSRRLGGLKGN